MDGAHPRLARLEVLVLDTAGHATLWDWHDPEAPAPVTPPEPLDAVPYRERARAAAIRWRENVLGLPSHVPFGGHLLPEARAEDNLLPESAGAVAFFATRKLLSHQPTAHGPSRNLVSSQVQCVNALFPAAHQPWRLVGAFGEALHIDRIEPFDSDGAHVAFEYAPPGNLLGEGTGAGQTRIDAAFRYHDTTGRLCLALVEWKYTERYFGASSATTEVYRSIWTDPLGPVRTKEPGDGPLTYEQALVEPVYQRVRQQMLAWRLEQQAEFDRVVVVHVSPRQNTAYQTSLPLPAHREAGNTLGQVWERMLRHADRFVKVDAGVFLDPQVTSPEYVARYGHP